ncbi:FAD-dependent monooxygenase [Streptomyces sp. NBC_00083]|uniref:FAD-dependent monooxygenase n=1 Tax=Streptomyces sp. NBC_00083 TaxID=2975647 RepID=UPI0022585ACE|nr:FAD-dependent monooxygenase [Streptomyces sp. NBC_00083]MCX5386084.1 FAD-dependent monooxygenase [Streptomyces sp. NBC_00083]
MDPVIIVGAGPVGLVLALSLAAQGVPSVVLDEGAGPEEPRPVRTAVLRPDIAAFVAGLGCGAVADEGARWVAWRSMRRGQLLRRVEFGAGRDGGPSPVHVPQHALVRGLRAALAASGLVRLVTHSRLDRLEQDARGVSAHTSGPGATWWRGSYVVGCDGARSTVRKLLDVRFAGRTAVERQAVVALRAELPWPGEALLHRLPPWRAGGDEVTARPLAGGVWRLDWLLPPRAELVTPDALVGRVRDTLGGWCGGTPEYDLLDTGVHTVHHRLARRWRVRRAFLAGDAAHLLGALGTQVLDEGVRDAQNLAWKLARAWHDGPSEALLDSYQAERRTAVAARLRAADQSLPVVRGGAGLRGWVPGTARAHDSLVAEGQVGRGPLGAPPGYPDSPLAPEPADVHIVVGTPVGAPVVDVRVTAPDGSVVALRERLGRGRLVVVLVAPGTAVWDRRHWLTAGVMPRLTGAVAELPLDAELLVAEEYPGAPAHAVLLVRPDGHLAAAFNGVHPAELLAAAEAVRGGAGRGEAGGAGGGPRAGAGEGGGGADGAGGAQVGEVVGRRAE